MYFTGICFLEINAIVYHGGAVSRKIIRDYEFFYKKVDGRRRNMPKFDALITTYEGIYYLKDYL